MQTTALDLGTLMLIAAQGIAGLLGRWGLPLLKVVPKQHLIHVGSCLYHHSGCGCLGEKQPRTTGLAPKWRWLLRDLPRHAQSRHSPLTVSLTVPGESIQPVSTVAGI